MTREEKIAYLVDSDFKVIERSPEYLDSILNYGFKGYDNYTDEELYSAIIAEELYEELTA